MKTVTLKQLDAAEKAVLKAQKKYNQLKTEYTKNCSHPRTRHERDEWSRIDSFHCDVCGTYLGAER